LHGEGLIIQVDGGLGPAPALGLRRPRPLPMVFGFANKMTIASG
jgi:hypothetical protein